MVLLDFVGSLVKAFTFSVGIYQADPFNLPGRVPSRSSNFNLRLLTPLTLHCLFLKRLNSSYGQVGGLIPLVRIFTREA